MERQATLGCQEHTVVVPIDGTRLEGSLAVPQDAHGIVIFAHGTGSGRHSPRNRFVARTLCENGFGALLLDLLTTDEEGENRYTAEHRFDIQLLAARLIVATDWMSDARNDLPLGYFGASTGAAAALVAAAERPGQVRAIVSRGGRPDLAEAALERVTAPTLMIVGGADDVVLTLNRQALRRLAARDKEIFVVPQATHLFEEPGALEQVARLAVDWFTRYLAKPAGAAATRSSST